jgi:hypothetical protein
VTTNSYDCSRCPGYCCSYPVIKVGTRDLKRLARRFAIPVAAAERRFTRTAHGHDRVLKRKADEHFGRICLFFDGARRRCAIYQDRPEICRRFPSGGRCGYYDFLTFERANQRDPEFVANTNNGAWE